MLELILYILAWALVAVMLFGVLGFSFCIFSFCMVCLGFTAFEPFAMILIGNDPDDDYGG